MEDLRVVRAEQTRRRDVRAWARMTLSRVATYHRSVTMRRQFFWKTAAAQFKRIVRTFSRWAIYHEHKNNQLFTYFY
jgi:hypothetical protein